MCGFWSFCRASPGGSAFSTFSPFTPSTQSKLMPLTGSKVSLWSVLSGRLMTNMHPNYRTQGMKCQRSDRILTPSVEFKMLFNSGVVPRVWRISPLTLDGLADKDSQNADVIKRNQPIAIAPTKPRLCRTTWSISFVRVCSGYSG
jgi:hypothetical protein